MSVVSSVTVGRRTAVCFAFYFSWEELWVFIRVNPNSAEKWRFHPVVKLHFSIVIDVCVNIHNCLVSVLRILMFCIFPQNRMVEQLGKKNNLVQNIQQCSSFCRFNRYFAVFWLLFMFSLFLFLHPLRPCSCLLTKTLPTLWKSFNQSWSRWFTCLWLDSILSLCGKRL